MHTLEPRIHPGEILREEFLIPQGIAVHQLARHSGIPSRQLDTLLDGNGTITREIAEALSRTIGMDSRFWLALQRDYEDRSSL